MSNFANWLMARLLEKSTWAGIVTTVAAVYTGPHTAILGTVGTVIMGALGGVAIGANTTEKPGEVVGEKK